MSFGLLKHFKDRKRSGVESITTSHTEHVILGHDLGAVLKLVEIRRNFPEEKVRLISQRPINRQMLVENYDFGISLLRSPDAVEAIYKRFFNAKILPQKEEPSFYKDGKFHDFGGRAKSMEILSGEEFFTNKGYRLEIATLFDSQDWENLDSTLKDFQEIRMFESVEKTEPNDLVDQAEWTLTFKDFSKLTCKNLYVSMSPKKFLNLLQHKEKLTPELIDVCSAVKVQGAISVTWILNKEISAEDRTLFIPQSMTHEWGHFLVEFEPFNYSSKTQVAHVMFLVHEEEPQSEDLASKIRLMKRVLDRVFPHFEDHVTQEFIRFDEEMFVSDIKDGALEQVGFDYPNLKFIGQVSSVASEYANQKYIARTLLN